VSWDRAQTEARRWIDGLNLPTKSLKGKSINLTEQAKTLKHDPKYKAMVLEAASRLLRTRGVEMIVDKKPRQELPDSAPEDPSPV
jgi:hypothetical protein